MKITAKVLPNKEAYEGDLTLSVSKSKTFADCKAKFKFSYIEKLPRKDWDFHIFGKFLHEVLEVFHRGIIDQPSRAENWKRWLKSCWADCRVHWENQMTKSQIAEARDIIDTYEDILKEEGIPNVIGVEKAFYINLDNRVLLNGFIDRIQLDDDGMLHVADYKTTKQKKYLKDFFQLMTYAYALMVEDPELERVRASFVLLRHDFDYLTEEYRREDVMSIADKFIEYADSIGQEKLWRPTPQFLCKFCDYREQCNAGTDYLIKRGIIDATPKVGLSKW
jgi:putative RecB family exonuclease